LRELRRRSDGEWLKMDVMVLPTAGTIYTHEAVAAEPFKLNANLGYYTNFVNLLDLAAVAAPAGFRTNGLPFGVSFIGPAFSDDALLSLADSYHRNVAPSTPPGCVAVAVVGAHLSGQPLNWQLTSRGARLMKTCRTAPGYRLYALDGTVPPKPGLVRDLEFAGEGIEVEVWAVPEDRFGGFVAAVPAPLGIGSATLDSGEVVKCFICEGYAIEKATEITSFGGWRNYLRGSRG
jgi:allophanate hydrolase